MRRLLALVILSALAVGYPTTTPAGKLSNKIDKIFAKYDSDGSPGCSVALVRDGRIVAKRGYGMANLDHDVPITPGTVFHVASVSKQFTAAAIVLLALDGKLSLDDEVREHLPELPDFGRRITIRHLVHHVSGVRDQWELLELGGWRYSRDLISDDDVMWILAKQRELNFEPGEKYLYSNSGYTLLSQIVERVSGKSLREFTRERIFEPLGMESTFFRDDFNEVVKRQAYGYVPKEGEEGLFRLSVTNFDTVGATSLLTTVEDMARWDGNFDDPRVGGEAFVRQIHERFRLNDGEEIDYAFGLSHGTHRGLKTVSHSGGDAGYRSYFVRFPEQRVSVVCLCNVPADSRSLAFEVAELVLGEAMAEPEQPAAAPGRAAEPVAVDEALLSAKEGLYWNPEDDGFLEIAVREGVLHVIAGGDPYELVALADDHFRVKQFPVGLKFNGTEPGTDGPSGMTVVGTSGDETEFERVEQAQLSPAELEVYSGTYVADELDIPYRLRVEEEALVLRRMKAEADSLRPTMKDVFVGDIGTLRFTRDAEGRLSGFLLSSGRVRNLKFRPGR